MSSAEDQAMHTPAQDAETAQAPEEQTKTGSGTRNRKIEPVSEEMVHGEIFDPSALGRPLLALLLMSGPLLAMIGAFGWLRLLAGVPLPVPDAVDWNAFLLDLLLLLVFLVPHSLFSRGVGRRWLNQPLGPAAERPLYVLITGIGLTLMAFAWTTTGPVLWDHGGVLEIIARLVQFSGLSLVLWSAWVVGPGRLLGLAHLRSLESGRQAPAREIVALPPYRWLRQPMNLGFLLLLIGMPELTLDRLLLGAGLASWILLIAPYEERDAAIRFGEAYARYKQRTPRWIPRFGSGRSD